VVGDATLNRFFALHVVALPLILVMLVFVHIVALHHVGSNNPDGIDIKKHKDENGRPLDSVPFHPYYTIKDSVGIVVYLAVFAFLVFFMPNYLGHPDNYIPANPLSTPAHIVPEWYFLPFYAILRAVPDKLGGVLLMFAAIAVLFILPWLDTSKVRSMRYRPLARQCFWAFAVTCVMLGWLGSRPAEGIYVTLSMVFTALYFAYFLIALPLLGLFETPKTLPGSIAESVLAEVGGGSGSSVGASAAAEPNTKG
jgi:ubiquinol-cytochrome c reductase cytochrome b subunit